MTQEQPDPETTSRAILSAAIGVFMTFGYRKTSLSDVATAANLSRQTLYIQFKNKSQLFRESVAYDLSQNLADAKSAIAGTADPRDALLHAFHFWHGQFIGQKSHVETDFLNAAFEHAGDIMADREAAFLKLIGEHLRDHNLVPNNPANLNASDIVDVLNTQSKGLKMSVSSSDQYQEKLTVALNAFVD